MGLSCLQWFQDPGQPVSVSSPLKLRNTSYFQQFERRVEDEPTAVAVARARLLVFFDFKQRSETPDRFPRFPSETPYYYFGSLEDVRAKNNGERRGREDSRCG
ncbi:hypothetical protein ACFXTN_031356 [Malus domestica]